MKKNLKTKLPFGSAILLLGTYPKKPIPQNRDSYIFTSISKVLLVAKYLHPWAFRKEYGRERWTGTYNFRSIKETDIPKLNTITVP